MVPRAGFEPASEGREPPMLDLASLRSSYTNAALSHS